MTNFSYNFKSTEKVKDGGKFLSAGIHDVTFKSVSLDTIVGKDGTKYNVMKLTVDVDGYGEYSHNFFEPTSDQRTSTQYGENPSQVEQFMIIIRQILEAIDPEVLEKIYASEKGLGTTFVDIVKNISKITSSKSGTATQLKLIPNGNFNQIPSFPARITKDGNLGIATRFIGKDLVLSSTELKKVEAVKNAKPTSMNTFNQSQATKDLLADINADFGGDSSDDLPF